MDTVPGDREVDEDRVAQFLWGRYFDDRTEYSHLRRLPPAHMLIASGPRAITIERYWSLEQSDVPPDWANAFETRFLSSVEREMERDHVGLLLSGGLDSSSIAHVARRLAPGGDPIPTFSTTFDATPHQNERHFIEAALHGEAFEPHFVAGDNYRAFVSYPAILLEQDCLPQAMGLPLSRELYGYAADSGVRVLLDGLGGDEVVALGASRLRDLARDRAWPSLWREVKGLSQLYNTSAVAMFLHLATQSSWRWRSFRRSVGAFRQNLMGDIGSQLSPYENLLNPDLASKTEIRKIAADHARAGVNRSEAQEHIAALTSPLQGVALEILFYASQAKGVELRFPFWDKSLIELCVALPARSKLRGGFTKIPLRRAMRNTLPAAIRTRRDKFNFLPHAARSILLDQALVDEILHDDAQAIAPYVNIRHVRKARQTLLKHRDKTHGAAVRAVWRATTLGLWLRHIRERNCAHSQYLASA